MSHEVDVIAVGDESSSGDAIVMRFGNFLQDPNDQKIVVIDGGFKDSGEKIVERIRNEYGSEYVDLVISTHPDKDHVSGLHVVLEELSVGELWMHRPWHMSAEIKKLSEEHRGLTKLGLSSKLKQALEAAYDLEKLAERKGVIITDPFQGLNSFENSLHVLGPSESFYQSLVCEFEKSATHVSLPEKVKRIMSELWHKEELSEPESGAVNARNNSSVVLLFQYGDVHFLFTGDGGTEALHHAADYAELNNYSISDNVKYFQVPHHGSKRNLGPSVLNRIIGPTLPEGTPTTKHAFISAAVKGEPHHPSKRVTNALVRRGMTVSATCGQHHCFKSLDVPNRPGWGPIAPIDFCDSFEEEE